tara:strand:- start:814 stop:1641 length:828 start_codon:yes stop_codon:yes gene_type:complete
MKNILKSLFISVFPVFALLIFIKTIINTDFNSGDISILIFSLIIVVFFSMLFIKPVARTTKNVAPYSFIILISALVSLFDFDRNTLLINASLVLGWLAYLKWYSTFNNRKNRALQVGVKLPDFTLENSKKESIKTTDLTGDYKIFLFYRGNWCPLCMAQIKEVVNQYKELEKRNIDMVLISSQPHKFTESLANKHKVPFHFLVDFDHKMAKHLKIHQKNGLPTGFQVLGYDSDVVLPTVIITDKNDTIIFADLTDNYRVRPEPKVFLEIIDTHKE